MLSTISKNFIILQKNELFGYWEFMLFLVFTSQAYRY